MVSMPTGTTIRSTTSGSLKLSGIPIEARKAHTFGDLTEWSLLSLRQLCDSGISATLYKHSVSATLGNDVVLSGHRNDSTNRVDSRLLKASECVQCLPCCNASQIGSVLPRALLQSDISFLEEVISTRCKSSWHLHPRCRKTSTHLSGHSSRLSRRHPMETS